MKSKSDKSIVISIYFCSICWVPHYPNQFLIFGFFNWKGLNFYQAIRNFILDEIIYFFKHSLTSLPPWWINQFRGWSKYPNIEAYFVSGFFDCPQAVLRPEIITPTFERIKLGFELTSIWTMMPIFAHQYFNVMHITNQISSIFVLGIFPKKWRPTVTRATTWYKERFFESNKIN